LTKDIRIPGKKIAACFHPNAKLPNSLETNAQAIPEIEASSDPSDEALSQMLE
jgi:hypothetical protein